MDMDGWTVRYVPAEIFISENVDVSAVILNQHMLEVDSVLRGQSIKSCYYAG
jgi:hypothetical protein